nr:unnamed protein product [Callosobruchus analis]
MDNEVDQGEFKNLIKKRGVIKSKQTLFKKRFDAINSEISDKSLSGVPEEVILELQNRLENLTKVFNEFDDIQNSIELLCDENTLDQQLAQREEVETLHYSLSAKGKKIVDDYYALNCKNVNSNASVGDIENQSAVLSQASNNFRDHCDIKLPSISLPKFKGDYHSWLEFHDFFVSIIHSKENILTSINFIICNHLKSLFSINAVSSESAADLRKLVDNILKHLQSLKLLKLPTESWDILLIYMFSQKLDKKTAREWEERKVSATHKCTDDSSSGGSNESVDSAELPTLQEFLQFLRQKADLLETIELKDQRYTKFDSRDSRQKGVHHSYALTNQSCAFCEGDHFIQNCPDFIKLPVDSREQHTKQLKLCFNCLNRGHNIKQCQSSGCRKCESNSTVFLQTALVQVFDGNGVPQICRALLDSASQSNLITSECCDRLGLTKENLPSAVLGVGENVSHLEYKCRVQIKACNNEFSANLMCLVIQKSVVSLPYMRLTHLLDPDFDKPAEIDLLICGGLYLNLLCVDRITLGGGLPILQKTRLGWVVGGEMVTRGIGQTFQNVKSPFHMVKFWEIEECGDKNPVLSEDDVQCEKIFSSTTSRSVDGKFVWKFLSRSILMRL